MKTKQKGLTLIELMIVVAIVGIFAAWAVPQLQGYIVRTQVARVMSEAGQYMTPYEDCINNGRTSKISSNSPAGTTVEANECSANMTASNLIQGDAQGDGAKAKTGLGYPQMTFALTSATSTVSSDTSTGATTTDGSGTIVATFGNNASASIRGKTLTWSRDTLGTWTCTSTVEDQYKPTGCK